MSFHSKVLFFGLSLVGGTFACAELAGQTAAWTQRVIKQEDRAFDFKTVARGTKSEHRFELYNPCAEKLHIASVSASCTCVEPFLLDEKSELQTYEKTAVVAHFHTEANEGLKSATITVVIDKPQYAEIQLQVQGNIRSDIAVTPNEVRIGPVKEGQGAERTVTVVYTGNSANWRIVDFDSPNKNITAEIIETKSEHPGNISSKIKVKLAADTPRGEINERLTLISNDIDARRELPILVSAAVGKVLTLPSQTLFLGYLKPGVPSRRDMPIRCTEPFKITSIECDDPNVEFDFTPNSDSPAKRLYQIPVVFRNPPEGSPKLNKEDGTLLAVVKIETDDPTLKVSFNVTAQVLEDPMAP